MEVGKFKLTNEDKAHRAIHGNVTRAGQSTGGVGEKATEEQILAEYDRLGGHVTLDGDRVKTGSFYDFKSKKPRDPAVVVLQFPINGQTIEVRAGKALPMEVIAYKKIQNGETAEDNFEPDNFEDEDLSEKGDGSTSHSDVGEETAEKKPAKKPAKKEASE